MKRPTIYILTNHPNGTMYIGMTTDLSRRLEQHETIGQSTFVRKHGLDRLVYIEPHETIETAALRERQLKKWNRAWKIRLIEESNPDWNDLRHLLT